MIVTSIETKDNKLIIHFFSRENDKEYNWSVGITNTTELNEKEEEALYRYLKEKAHKIKSINFEEYQNFTDTTAIYPNKGNDLIYPILGLNGEVGEVTEKIKKIRRDKQGIIEEADRLELAKELGDICWYIAACCTELNISFQQIIKMNIDKLNSRKERKVLQGSGDNR